MSRTNWKQVERDAAACIGAERCWANQGGREDAVSPFFASQVKNPKELSLAELTRLVNEMTVRAADSGRLPLVFVKASLGSGCPTPLLVVLPATIFGALWEQTPDRWRNIDSLPDGSVRYIPSGQFIEFAKEKVRASKLLRGHVAKYVVKAMSRDHRNRK